MQSVSRGSFLECISKCYQLFNDGAYEYLSIFCNPRGKYYMIVTEAEIPELELDRQSGHIRLVMRIRKGELEIILSRKLIQLCLFPDSESSPRIPS